MPDSRSIPAKGTSPTGPRAALDALRTGANGDTLRRAQWLAAVDQLLRSHLPAGAAAHAHLANVRGSKLVFVVDAPVWHAKLRLAAPELIAAARSIGLEVNDVGVKLTPQRLQPHPPAATRHAPISAAGRRGLEAALAMLRTITPDDAKTECATVRRRSRKAPAEPAKGAS